MAKKQKTTTRSYTLELRTPSDASDWLPLWNKLFQTHYTTCRGACEYGNFFLKLRGGLPESLAAFRHEKSAERRRLLQRGTRRILALGWLSIESARGAENNQYRVQELAPGQSLTIERAEYLLRDILCRHKQVSREADIADWVSDCTLALTANIRSDAVIVNRAAEFAQWQREVGNTGAEMPEQAKRILFAVCGGGFVSLRLPDESNEEESDDANAETTDADGDEISVSQIDSGEIVEPSNASRRVFGDLFGRDASEKLSRAAGKEQFAVRVRDFLLDLHGEPPTSDLINAFRQQQNFPPFDFGRPDKYPPEVSSSGAPTAVAKRYRKLLVSLELWPASDEEAGLPRAQTVSRFGKQVSAQDERLRTVHLNALDLLDACPGRMEHNQELPAGRDRSRVYAPIWADTIADQVATATGMPKQVKSFNEFKRLMFALAARRINQTQSSMKRNEVERHMAAVRENAAERKFDEFDPTARARTWLVKYESDQATQSGSSSGFRITRRMIGECDAVFHSWKNVATAEERHQQTVLVQTKTEGFGDARFYADLSDDPQSAVIWQHEQGGELLREWVKLRQAQYDQQRLRIPRYCHPDAFNHPTWCEFGGSSKPKVWYAWSSESMPQKPEPGGDADGLRRLWMLLPDFEEMLAKAVPFRWCSKRLSRDLGDARQIVEKPISRADRQSIAAAQLPLIDQDGLQIRYRPEFPFTDDAKGWNARLQISRDILEQLEKQWVNESADWRDAGKALRNARWFLTFAPTLVLSDGPGREIHPKLGWKSNPYSDLNKKQKREGRAKLALARLPGLRILSVKLSHRFAAACAVWEAVAAKTVHAACDQAGIPRPTSSDLFVFVPKKDQKGHTLFRRIGPVKLDKKDHPAPWARLERSFLIRLQGEDQPARWATDEELNWFRKLESELGYIRNEDNQLNGSELRVDNIFFEAVRLVRQALRRHSDYVRIADGLIAIDKPGVGNHPREKLEGQALIEHLQDLLVRWHALKTPTRWRDNFAIEQWNEFVQPLLVGVELPAVTDDMTGPQRKSIQKQLRAELQHVARQLTTSDRTKIHVAWATAWRKYDAAWPQRLKSLRRCIAPRGKKQKQNESLRQVGGLSLTRVATITELYQVQKSFFTRLQLDSKSGRIVEPRAIAGRRFAQKLLDQRDAMRENRVKQLASRIVEAALGIGSEDREKHWSINPRTGKKTLRPRSLIKDDRFLPCHAVVIESLTRYRPDELQTRRENRQLMSWSSSKVKKFLSEACQLQGLHLREVFSGHTSRQDFRSGAPGLRCVDMTVAGFCKKFHRELKRAMRSSKPNGLERYFLDLAARHCEEKNDLPVPKERHEKIVLRIPRQGGDFFVSVNHVPTKNRRKGPPGVQADLNAAGNIGLNALLDPDWAGAWWYVPTVLDKDGYRVPHPEKTKGTPIFDSWKVSQARNGYTQGGSPESRDEDLELEKPPRRKRPREVINLWRDVSDKSLEEGNWRVYAAYNAGVRWRVIQILRQSMDLAKETVADFD